MARRLSASPACRALAAAAALALASASFGQSAFVRGRFAEAPKPPVGTVALVLSAGAQLGWAHLGVLEWLEEHRVPVHCVVGTSMGSLVGGFYSAGADPKDIENLLGTIDWNQLLQNEPPYSRLTVRRKQDRRDVPGILEFGYRRGLTAPVGISSAPLVSLLLSRGGLPYDEDTDFDHLMLPFRAVSFDYINLRRYVPSGGSLPLAIRASISIPLAFSPAIAQGHVLGDGGVVEVLPVQTALDTFHPDAVIAVNVQPDVDLATPDVDTAPIRHPEGAPTPAQTSQIDIFGQGNAALMAMGEAQVREAKERVAALGERGIWIQPDVVRYVKPWSEWRFYVRKGYEAAEAMADRFKKFELSEPDWARYLAWRDAERIPKRFAVQNVDVVAAPASGGRIPAAEKKIASSLQPEIGQTLDATRLAHPSPALSGLESRLEDALGGGRYQSTFYEAAPDRKTLRVYAMPKTYGPTLFYLSPEIDATQTLQSLAGLRGRFVRFDPIGWGSEARLDLALGTQNALGLELYRPAVHGGFFGALRLRAEQESQGIFVGEGDAETARREAYGAGLDAGLTVDRNTEIRLGYDIGHAALIGSSAPSAVPTYNGFEQFLSLRGTFDGANRAMIPSRGLRADAAARYFLDTPDGGGLWQAQGDGALFVPLGNGSAFAFGGAGSQFGASGYGAPFEIPAVLSLGSLSLAETVSGNYASGGAGYMLELGRLPELLGSGTLRLGLWGQWTQLDAPLGGYRPGWSISAGGFLASPLGPVFLGATRDADDRTRLQLRLGRLF